MDHIETKILNSYTIQEAAQNMVFAARLTQYEATTRKPLDEILVKLDKILGVLSLYDKIN